MPTVFQFFVFRFPTTLKAKSIFVFPLLRTTELQFPISVFRLLFSYGIEKRNFNFDFRFSLSSCSVMLSQDSSLSSILGDPGAVSGDGEKSKTGEEKFGRRKVKNAKKSSSFRS